jgi:hypothetical protein
MVRNLTKSQGTLAGKHLSTRPSYVTQIHCPWTPSLSTHTSPEPHTKFHCFSIKNTDVIPLQRMPFAAIQSLFTSCTIGPRSLQRDPTAETTTALSQRSDCMHRFLADGQFHASLGPLESLKRSAGQSWLVNAFNTPQDTSTQYASFLTPSRHRTHRTANTALPPNGFTPCKPSLKIFLVAMHRTRAIDMSEKSGVAVLRL